MYIIFYTHRTIHSYNTKLFKVLGRFGRNVAHNLSTTKCITLEIQNYEYSKLNYKL